MDPADSRAASGAMRSRCTCRAVVLASFPVLPYDEAAARWHEHERARLEGLGKPPSCVDGQIAAIAVTNGLILATSNFKDFTRFRDLQVDNWGKRRS